MKKKKHSPEYIALEIANHYTKDYEIPIGLVAEMAKAIRQARKGASSETSK